MRLINLIAFGTMVGLLCLIYQLKFETRQLEGKTQELRRLIAEEKDTLGVLRAEWTYLTRPSRLEKLALEKLNLRPLKPEQVVRYEEFAHEAQATPSSEEHAGERD